MQKLQIRLEKCMNKVHQQSLSLALSKTWSSMLKCSKYCAKVRRLNNVAFLQQIITSNLKDHRVKQLKSGGKDSLSDCLTAYVQLELCAIMLSNQVTCKHLKAPSKKDKKHVKFPSPHSNQNTVIGTRRYCTVENQKVAYNFASFIECLRD